MDEKNSSNELIGRKMIETAVSLDESLIEILKIEIRRLKQLAKTNNAPEELHRTNNLIRNIIMALTITDEKIKTGIDLCFGNINTKHF
ncbi:MAG: hypothetical protein PHS15_03895 [Clostridiaceae bacterium]|nr:hypothetical protein [Clostridiaceae bacterium]